MANATSSNTSLGARICIDIQHASDFDLLQAKIQKRAKKLKNQVLTSFSTLSFGAKDIFMLPKTSRTRTNAQKHQNTSSDGARVPHQTAQKEEKWCTASFNRPVGA